MGTGLFSAELRSARCGRFRLLLPITGLALLLPTPAASQDVRPGDVRPELPRLEPGAPAPEPILPPLELPELEAPATESLERGEKVFVREVRVTGNTVLEADEIAEITSAYEGRNNSFADLQNLRDRLSVALVSSGYITSGAVIPRQAIRNGVLDVRIVEGTLAGIEVETSDRLKPSYVRNRLERSFAGPVNVRELEERLQILQQDALIDRVHASLVPGEERGISTLRVRVDESRPVSLQLRGDNHHSPNIGSWGGSSEASWFNISGYGDAIWTRYTGSEGLNEIQTRYEVPLSAADTRLDFHVEATWSEVVEEPFDDLDIESNTQTYGFTLTQPVYRSMRTGVDLFMIGEWRRSKSYLLGRGFAFSEGVSDDGVAKLTVLRSGLEWTSRSREQVFAARLMMTWGIDILGATNNGGDRPDGLFLSWLGQIQWARRLPFLDAQLLARFDVQLTESPLLALEQFAMGGYSTVRGYRENTFVRDNGLIGSLELRFPLWTRSDGRIPIEVGPFLDVGYSWNHPRSGNDTLGPSTLVGLGLAARVALADWLFVEAAWAEDLKNVSYTGDDAFQDHGFHLGVTVALP